MSHALFVYGTLMAPAVLYRVCHGSSAAENPIHAAHQLRTRPAVLAGYRRHRVKDADYPAVVAHHHRSDRNDDNDDNDSKEATASVRGVYVSGLTDGDMWRLDIFEGAEYRRERVRVRLLSSSPSSSSLRGREDSGAGGEAEEEEEEEDADAETYVWCASREALEEREWDFDEFRREKMRFWVGGEGGEGEFAEVDKAVATAAAAEAEKAKARDGTGGRGVNGHITNALNEEMRRSAV